MDAKASMAFEAEGPHCFWINNGPVVKNLPELLDAVREMSDDLFAYHTKGGQNDFVVWIEQVLGEKQLASRLKKLKSKRGFVNALAKALE